MAISISVSKILLQLQLDSSKTGLVNSLVNGCIQEALTSCNLTESDVEGDEGFINAVISYIGAFVTNPKNIASEKFDTYSVSYSDKKTLLHTIFKPYRVVKFV
jgi:hypothetical protein